MTCSLKYLKDYFINIMIGFCLYHASIYLNSDFYYLFLKNNYLTIIIALLAINTTTISIILSKIKELEIRYEKSSSFFDKSYNAMKNSIVEQIFHLIIAVFLLILLESELIMKVTTCYPLLLPILKITLFSLPISTLQVLYDTCKASFILRNL